MLADSAKLVGGKLYLLGGAWSILNVNDQFPHTQMFGLAISFLVPSSWHGRRINFEVAIVAEGANTLIMEIAGELEATSAGLAVPDDFERATMAAEAIVALNEGAHVVTARVEGGAEKVLRFHVLGGPGLTPPRRRRSNRTRIPLQLPQFKLAQFGDDQLMSRSAARGVLARFERFTEVFLDFQGGTLNRTRICRRDFQGFCQRPS